MGTITIIINHIYIYIYIYIISKIHYTYIYIYVYMYVLYVRATPSYCNSDPTAGPGNRQTNTGEVKHFTLIREGTKPDY